MVPTHRTASRTNAPTRQLLIVATCVVGLLVAAAAMPATAPQPTPPDFLSGESDCQILFSEDPVAGHELTTTVLYDEEPVSDSPVWFNGERVGRTDEDGQVVGTVPYEQTLQVRVELPGGGSCAASIDTGDSDAPLKTVDRSGLGVAAPDGVAQQQAQNGSGAYPVRGRIDLSVDEQPYPGETTTLRATIQGNPVADAAVSVDGRTIGRTDADGTIEIRAPIEGDRTLTVHVERGAFERETEIVVLRLDATIRTDTLLPLPGQSATVAARLGDRPAVNATALVGGERLGRTDADGHVEMTLPADPTARLTVATADQVATTPVLLAFAPTILLTLLAVLALVGVPAAGYSIAGRRGMAIGSGVAVSVLALAYVFLRFGRTIALLGSLALLAVVGLAAFLRSDYSALQAARATAGWFRRLGRRLAADGLWLSGRLEAAVGSLERRLRRLRDRLTGPDATPLADAGRWLTSLPARLVAFVRALARGPSRLFDSEESDRDDLAAESGHADDETTLSRRAQFRRVWRAFAGRVAPETWPRRTAGEVSRRAIDRGLSPGPVRELTDTFRAVEYGDESLTDGQVERARAALNEIRDDSEEGSA